MIDDDLAERFPPPPRWFVVACVAWLVLLIVSHYWP